MLIKLWCWLWGHKTLLKAYTGQTIQATNPLTGTLDTLAVYKWEKQKHCLRCHKEV